MSDNIKDNKSQKGEKALGISASFYLGHLLSNGHYAFVVRKAERLASALYVITGFIPPEEPVRESLRKCAIELINRSSDQRKLNGPSVEFFASKCMEVGALLEVAKSGGLVSQMNAKLISEEYASLASFVRDNQGKIFEREVSVPEVSFPPEKVDDIPIGQNEKILQSKSVFKSGKIRQIGQKNTQDRRSSVLAVFKDKSKFSIKDITASVVGCSEKTIQRELLALVQSGVLIKEGERRWSTYRKA